jgi:hypothetical protein
LKELVELLGGDYYAYKGLELLIKHSDGIIPPDELDEELLLLLEGERLAVPVNSQNDSLAWGMRVVTITSLEIPYFLRFFFSELRKGKASWENAVKGYFERIGEDGEDAKTMLEIVKRVVETRKGRKGYFISGSEITAISEAYGKDGGVVIAELKGAGIISPFSGCGRSVARMETIYGTPLSPIYEINRFLVKLFLKCR